jgi:hypothetical protein
MAELLDAYGETKRQAVLAFNHELFYHKNWHSLSETAKTSLMWRYISLSSDIFHMFCTFFCVNTQWCVVNTDFDSDWAENFITDKIILEIDEIHLDTCWKYFESKYYPNGIHF